MVYVFLADGFEETEALVPVDVMRRSGIEVRTVGVGKKTVTGSHKITVTADITSDEISLDRSLEMIVLPGGMPGTLNLGNSQDVLKAIKFCSDNNNYIAAICAAPSVLGSYHLLEGRHATCFPGYEEKLLGAKVMPDAVVIDGNIITSRGMGTSIAFGAALVSLLTTGETAAELLNTIQYRKGE